MTFQAFQFHDPYQSCSCYFPSYQLADSCQADVQLLWLQAKFSRHINDDFKTSARHQGKEISNNQLEALKGHTNQSFTAGGKTNTSFKN